MLLIKQIHFKLILLTLLYKYLFFKINLKCSYIFLLDTFSIIMQWAFYKDVLSTKIKTDIFSKSAFWCQKIIVIIYQKQQKNFSAVTLFLSLSSKREPTSTALLPCFITPDSFQTWPFSTIFFCHFWVSLICLIYFSLIYFRDIVFDIVSLPNLFFLPLDPWQCFWKFYIKWVSERLHNLNYFLYYCWVTRIHKTLGVISY